MSGIGWVCSVTLLACCSGMDSAARWLIPLPAALPHAGLLGRTGPPRTPQVWGWMVVDAPPQACRGGLLALSWAPACLFMPKDRMLHVRPCPAELATTVEAPVRAESLGEEDISGLLDGV